VCGMSIQTVIQDPIPFLILLGLVVLTVWLWGWFKRRVGICFEASKPPIPDDEQK
jgi:hypothetical protein